MELPSPKAMKSRRKCEPILFLGAAFWAGCSSDDSSPAQSQLPDAALSGDGDAAMSLPQVSDGGNDGADQRLAYGRQPGTGQIVFRFPFLGTRFDWGATFVASDSPSWDSRTLSKLGGCTEYLSFDIDPPTPVYVSAGALTASGGGRGFARTIPATAGRYAENTESRVGGKFYFDGGEELQFAATGETVPPFVLKAKMALVPLLDAPTRTAATELTVPRSEDLTLRWQRGAANLYIALEFSASRPKRQGFNCLFDSQLGQATIPRAVLEGLGTDGFASIQAVTFQHARAGSFAIEAAVITSVHYAIDRQPVGRMFVK